MANDFLNAVGSGNSVGKVMGGEGGNGGKGYIDQTYPTGVVARGAQISMRGGDAWRGERRGMSVERNSSKARGMSDRQ